MQPWLPMSNIAKCFWACAAFAFIATFPALATVTIGDDFAGTYSEVFTSTSLSYSADVSATDLLHGITPADGATNVSLASDLIATFNENIALASRSIVIKNLNSASETVITLPDARVSVSSIPRQQSR